METIETEALPTYSYEELVILWESGMVRKYCIIEQMTRLWRQGGDDGPKAEAFLRELAGSEDVEGKKCALKVLRAARADKGNHL